MAWLVRLQFTSAAKAGAGCLAPHQGGWPARSAAPSLVSHPDPPSHMLRATSGLICRLRGFPPPRFRRPMGTVVLKSTVSSQAPPAAAEPAASGSGGEGSAPAARPHVPPPLWSELCTDIVVNEKALVGSRWGLGFVAAARHRRPRAHATYTAPLSPHALLLTTHAPLLIVTPAALARDARPRPSTTCSCGPIDEALRLMAGSERVRALLRSLVTAELPLREGERGLALAGQRGTLKVQLVMGRS